MKESLDRQSLRRCLLLVSTVVALGAATLFGAATATARVATGSWSGAQAISPVNQPDPTRGSQLNDVAVNTSGLAVAAWDQLTYNGGGGASIGAAVRSGGKWSAPFTISGLTGFSMAPRVAVGADGTMAVSWTYQDPVATTQNPLQKVQVAVRQPGSASWKTATLDTGSIGGVDVTSFVPLGVDASGNVTAAWTMWDGTRHVVKAATMPAGGTWSSPTTLSGPLRDGLSPSLAVNAQGDAAVVYSLSPYSSYATGTWAEYVARGHATGTWSAPVQVSETISSSVGYVTSPQVALDREGLATVVYMGQGLEATRQLATGWTDHQSVIVAPNQVSSYLSPDLGVDESGNAVVAVSIFDATVNVDRASVWVARFAAGTWSTQQRITDPTVPIDAYATRVAVSPDGALALVGWIDHYHGTVQVASLPGGTASAPAAAWTTKTVGRGTAWSSFQEVLGLDAASSSSAVAIWKNARQGTQTMASTYGK